MQRDGAISLQAARSVPLHARNNKYYGNKNYNQKSNKTETSDTSAKYSKNKTTYEINNKDDDNQYYNKQYYNNRNLWCVTTNTGKVKNQYFVHLIKFLTSRFVT